MDVWEIYSTCRARLLDVAPTLSLDQLSAPLPATPPWVVLDGYRHLAGVCTDILDGAMEGAGSPEWTAVQLASRQDRTIQQVCAEWGERGPQLDARVAEAGEGMAFVAFDAWTHGQDVRAAIGGDAIRSEELVTALASIAIATFGRRYSAAGAPALRVVVDGVQHPLGEGGSDSGLTLNTTAYELLRIIFGRRSRDQIEAAGWSGGDPALAIDAIHLFDCPVLAVAD